MTKQKTILTIIILLLIIGSVYFGFGYLNTQEELRQARTALENQKTNKKVLDFTKLFIEKILKAETEVDFETRLKLENAIRNLDDKEILERCNKFVNSKNEGEAQSQVKNLLELLVNKIKEKLITSDIESTYYNLHLLLQGDSVEANTVNTKESLDLDDIDIIILKELSKNCRISLLNLSEKVKLTPNGTKDRIKKLEERKIIIAYKTKINYEKLDYLHFRLFLHLKNFDENLYSKIKSFLKNKGNIESVSRYIGYADVDLRCYTKGIVELYQLITEIKDNFLEEIIEINSVPIFGWDRINYYSK